MKLKTLLEVQSGFAFKTECFSETSGIPLIRIRDLQKTTAEIFYNGEFRPEFLVERGDYLIGMDGNFRCFEWQGGQALLNQRVCRLRNFSTGVVPEYIYYGIEKKLIEIEEGTSFATVKHISAKQILDIELPLPPLTEQLRIVDLLTHAAGIRRLRQQALETTRTLIPALFVKMFGDPARNEKGWEVATVGNILELAEYGTSQKASEEAVGVPVLRMGNVTMQGELNLDSLKYMDLSAAELDKYRLQTGDLLFNRTNSKELVGKTGIWDGRFEAVAASYFIRLRVDGKRVDPWYVWCYFNSKHMKKCLFETARGAIGQANINAKEVKAFRLSVPPLALQQTFAAHVADLHALITQQERHLVQAEALLQSLMSRFFGGEVDAVTVPPGVVGTDCVLPGRMPCAPPQDLPIAAEAPTAYTAGGQAAFPAANQPVPARILAAMTLGRDYSRAELLAATGISAADWTGAIRQLKEDGMVIQAGEKRGARYVLAGE